MAAHELVSAAEPALHTRCAIVGHYRPNSVQSRTSGQLIGHPGQGGGARRAAGGNDDKGAYRTGDRGGQITGPATPATNRRAARRARVVGPAGDRGASGALARAGTRPGRGASALAGRRLGRAPGRSRPGATAPAGGLARTARRADRGTVACHAPVLPGRAARRSSRTPTRPAAAPDVFRGWAQQLVEPGLGTVLDWWFPPDRGGPATSPRSGATRCRPGRARTTLAILRANWSGQGDFLAIDQRRPGGTAQLELTGLGHVWLGPTWAVEHGPALQEGLSAPRAPGLGPGSGSRTPRPTWPSGRSGSGASG